MDRSTSVSGSWAKSIDAAGMAADALGTLRMRVDRLHRIVGCIHTLNGSNVPVPWLFRLTASGGYDTSFAMTGSKLSPSVRSHGLACDGFAVASDGRIVLASYDGSNQYIMRFRTRLARHDLQRHRNADHRAQRQQQ